MDGVHRRQIELTGTIMPRIMRHNELSCLFSMSKRICFYMMVVGALIVVYMGSLETGWDAFKVVFFGSILDILFGMYVAYNIGSAVDKKLI